jgi:hypothetical protein
MQVAQYFYDSKIGELAMSLVLEREGSLDMNKKFGHETFSKTASLKTKMEIRGLYELFPRSGRAIAQAVSRRLPTAAAQEQTRVWSSGSLWWTKVALGQVFSENFCFPCQSTFHLLLHNHLHYHPRLAQ